MFKKGQSILLILIMFQLILGATAWMYSGHLCKMEDGCSESSEATCCMDEETFALENSPLLNEFECPTNTPESCCFEINTYFNFPLYRIFKTELPSDFFSIAFLGNLSIDVIGFNQLNKEDSGQLNFANSESPPIEKLVLYSVFRI